MAISRERKEKIVAALIEDLDKAGSVVLTDFTGVNVQDMTELRNQMRENNVNFTIVKNTLLNRVFNQLKVDKSEGIYSMFEGPTALAYSADEVLPVKLIKKFALDHKGLPQIKGGLVSGETYEVSKMMELAEIPSRDELLARILGSANSPLQGFVSVTSGIIRKLFYTVLAVQESRKN